MGTSTNRPKPKSSQSAARNGSGKPGGNQGTTGAAEPTAKPASGTLPSSSKTSPAKTAAQPTSAKAVSKTTPPPAKPQPAQTQTTRRDQKRDARREELNRQIEERRKQREREQRNRLLKRWTIFGVPGLVIAVVVGVLIYNALFGPQVAAYLKGNPIDGISCDALEQTQTHYHVHLEVFVNGTEVPIPDDVGRQSVTQCFYWLHVHQGAADAGVIHIESPDNRVFTLHQFFDIWGQQLTTTNLLGHKVDATHALTAYVYDPTDQPTDSSQPFTVTPPNDLKPYTGDPTKIALKPHELIVLEYGTPIVSPSPWTFQASE